MNSHFRALVIGNFLGLLALCLLAAVILVTCIDTKEFDSDNMMVNSYDNDTKEFGSDNMMVNSYDNDTKEFGSDNMMVSSYDNFKYILIYCSRVLVLPVDCA
jgi:hypothetical protein